MIFSWETVDYNCDKLLVYFSDKIRKNNTRISLIEKINTLKFYLNDKW